MLTGVKDSWLLGSSGVARVRFTLTRSSLTFSIRYQRWVPPLSDSSVSLQVSLSPLWIIPNKPPVFGDFSFFSFLLKNTKLELKNSYACKIAAINILNDIFVHLYLCILLTSHSRFPEWTAPLRLSSWTQMEALLLSTESRRVSRTW